MRLSAYLVAGFHIFIIPLALSNGAHTSLSKKKKKKKKKLLSAGIAPPPTIHKSSMPKARHADGGRLAPAMNLNSVKVYNLSSVGKALPAWLSAGKRKALVQKKEDNERRRSL